MRRWKLLSLLTLIATGCNGVITTGPLIDPVNSAAAPSLYGHWVAILKPAPNAADNPSATEEMHLFLGKHEVVGNPKSIVEGVLIGWSPELHQISDGPKVYFTTATLGNSSYLNLLEPAGGDHALVLRDENSYLRWADGKNRSCETFRYECDGKSLKIWGPTDNCSEMLKKLAADGKVELVGKDRVTAESLARYLRDEGGEKLFDHEAFNFKKATKD